MPKMRSVKKRGKKPSNSKANIEEGERRAARKQFLRVTDPKTSTGRIIHARRP